MAERKYVDEDPVRWNPTETYLYFIKCNKYVKIGISQRPLSRLHSIQVGNPYKCRIILLLKFPSKREAIEAEETLHQTFHDINKRGEWFVYTKTVDRYIKELK